jgi:hypothetical protein
MTTIHEHSHGAHHGAQGGCEPTEFKHSVFGFLVTLEKALSERQSSHGRVKKSAESEAVLNVVESIVCRTALQPTLMYIPR